MIKLNKMAVVAALVMSGAQVVGMVREQKAYTINVQSGLSIPELAQVKSDENAARAGLLAAGYAIGDGVLTRVVDQNSGEGFWHKIIDYGEQGNEHGQKGVQRMVYYGVGEYVNLHCHNLYEKFSIKAGGCHVWVSTDDCQTLTYKYCKAGEDLDIKANEWHCIVAGKDGLAMDVWNDIKRTTEWFDTTRHAGPWKSGLQWVIPMQELRAKTMALVAELQTMCVTLVRGC